MQSEYTGVTEPKYQIIVSFFREKTTSVPETISININDNNRSLAEEVVESVDKRF